MSVVWGLLCSADAPFYNPSITDKTSDIFFSPFGTIGIDLFGECLFQTLMTSLGNNVILLALHRQMNYLHGRHVYSLYGQ